MWVTLIHWMNCSFESLPQASGVPYFNTVPTLLFCQRVFRDLKVFVISVKIWSPDVFSVSNGFRYFNTCLLRVQINPCVLKMHKIVALFFPYSCKSLISIDFCYWYFMGFSSALCGFGLRLLGCSRLTSGDTFLLQHYTVTRHNG